MTTRKLGLLGLMLGATLLGAACDNTTTTPPPPVVVTLNLLPDAATLTVGQTLQMTVVITNSTNQAATFASSNTAVATVNATTGLVTAVAQGIAVITATSAADATAKDASTITVNPAVVVPPPTISIKSVTQGSLQTPVNPANVSGQIDVTLNLSVPAGAQVSKVETLIDGTPVCTQNFTGTGSINVGQDQTDAADEIVCPIFTNTFDAATGAVAAINKNGPHTLSARLTQPSGTVIAAPSIPLIYNNINLIVANIAASKAGVTAGSNARSIAGAGSLWNGGDVTVNLIPVNFGGASDAVASATVTLATSGVGVSGVAACRSTGILTTDRTIAAVDGGAGTVAFGVVAGAAGFITSDGNFPYCGTVSVAQTDGTASDGLSVKWLAANNPDATTVGVNNIEDIISRVTVTSITVGGNAGPACINPDPVRNPLATCATGNANLAIFANPLRLDNTGPRVTLFDLAPSSCENNVVGPPPSATGNCYLNGTFTFTAGTAGFFTAVDYGVDSQNANTTFAAGTTTANLANATGTASLAETLTANDLFLRATVGDALGNQRLLFPTDQATIVSTSTTTLPAGATRIQMFGVDKTPPVIQTVTGPANNSANDGNVFTITAIDLATPPAGPSGLGLGTTAANSPVVVRVEQVTSAGTVCWNTTGTATTNCSTGGNQGNGTNSIPNGAAITLAPVPANQGYFRVTYFVRDAAGNTTATTAIVTLQDVTPPVIGGISSPSIITGGAANTFQAAVSDNIDLGDAVPSVVYGGLELEYPTQAIGTGYFGTFETSATASVVLNPFIRSVSTGGLGVVASSINLGVRDQAGLTDNAPCPSTATQPGVGSCTIQSQNISANVSADFALTGRAQTNFAFTFGGMAVNNANVCNGDNAGGTQSPACPTNPTSTTLTGSVSGPTVTFNPNFSNVYVYAINPSTGRAVRLGTASVQVADNGVTRSFNYSFTWNVPTGLNPPGTVGSAGWNLFFLGVNALGDGLQSPLQLVTVNID